MASVEELIAVVEGGDAVAAEKAARSLREVSPKKLTARKHLLKLAMGAEDLRVRWNLIQVVGKLWLSPRQRAVAVDWLFERLWDPSPFTRTFALQALFDLSGEDAALRGRVLSIAREFTELGTASMRARARKLLRG